MAKEPFTASVRQESDAAVIQLSGEINSFAEDELNAAFDQAAQAKKDSVILDFSNVRYINSTGIAVIVGILARARTASIALIAFGLSEHYRQIFEITRLSDFMNIVSDEASALAQTR